VVPLHVEGEVENGSLHYNLEPEVESMKENLIDKVTRWMGEHFPTLEYRVVLHPDGDQAVVYETVDDRVNEGVRVWKWKRTGLRGWVKWEGRDK
jgi:hypothetical protein